MMRCKADVQVRGAREEALASIKGGATTRRRGLTGRVSAVGDDRAGRRPCRLGNNDTTPKKSVFACVWTLWVQLPLVPRTRNLFGSV